MSKDNNTQSVFRYVIQYILFGALIGILLGITGVLIYQGYLGQITNILLYVSLVFFGVVVLTFILVWGFKTYLTRLLFGSKVADSPDLIAEAQSIASQLSDGVIDKAMENATEEQREKAKGLVLRLGNWFVWGRLRNWWWSWILGIFVSLGGLTGTLLLVNQNQLIQHQMSLEEASRRGALVMLMSNIFDKVDDEIARQREIMSKHYHFEVDSTRYSLSQSLIGQISALSQSFKPYKYMEDDKMINIPLSPERGQLLITICRLPLDTLTVRNIFEKATFRSADLSGANLGWCNLSWADLSRANLSGAILSGCDLRKTTLSEANLNRATLFEANMTGAYLSNTNLKESILSRANLNGAILWEADLRKADLNSVTLTKAVLNRADLRDALRLTETQIANANDLYKCQLPKNINTIKLQREYPELFDNK